MDDLKLYGKSENEIKGLVSTVEVSRQDKGMEFGIRIRIELPSGEKIREIEEDGYKYLEIWSMTE